jgi:hypothetical protein
MLFYLSCAIAVLFAGPIMILELCDYALKDWLASLTQVTTDEVELMLSFITNIAQGMAHLHANKVSFQFDTLCQCN